MFENHGFLQFACMRLRLQCCEAFSEARFVSWFGVHTISSLSGGAPKRLPPDNVPASLNSAK